MSHLFFLASYVNGFTIRTARAPVPGETLIGRDFHFGPGGKGFNQAVAAARLGAGVSMVISLGDDFFGRYAEEALRRENIASPVVIKHAGVPTAAGFVTLTEDGENSILLDPGANLFLRPADIESQSERIRESDFVVSQLEVPLACTLRAFELAREAGVRTLLNPAPAQALPDALLALTDVLTPNESECRQLLGLAPDDPAPTEELAERLLAMGIRSLVITRGRRGALCVTNASMTPIPAHAVRPVDTTGAGDTFNAALVVALVAGRSLEEAATYAAAAGAYSTQFLGVIDGLPTVGELEHFIHNQPAAQGATI